MLNPWIRRAGWALAALALLAALGVTAGVTLAEQRMQRRIALPAVALALPDMPAAVERGRYLFASRGCADCHGHAGSGRTFADDGAGLRLAGANLTGGVGSPTAGYRSADWAAAIRHGVKPDGRPLMVMPSEEYARLTDADVGAIVAYLRTLAPVAGRGTVLELPLPMRLAYGFGLLRDAAAKIDHTLAPAAPVAEGVTVEHGRYVAQMCIGCHGATLAGGKTVGMPPDWPAPARLAPGEDSVMPRYASADAFVQMMRSGQRADGSAIKVMPFEALRQMNDTDLRALHLFLVRQPGHDPS